MKVRVQVFLSFVLLALFVSPCVYAQELISRNVEELPVLQSEQDRPVLIFLTAEWCTYCERIKQTSFKQKDIITTLNDYFYYIEFDIEQKEPVTIVEQKFVFIPTGVDAGIHQFAEAIGTVNGAVTTPTFVVLNSRWEILYQYNGFMDYLQIRALLQSVVNL